MRELGHGLQEYDAMRCRSCGNEERASEGAPCESCGTFLCIMCQFKGVTRCAACDGRPLSSSNGGTSRKNADNPVDTVISADSTSTADMIGTNNTNSGNTISSNADAAPRDAIDDEDMLIDRLFDELALPDDRPTP